MGLILASTSPTRAAMLAGAGVEFTAVAPQVDEAPIKDALLAEGLGARAIADALAEVKALRQSARHPGAFVLGSDTTVEVAGRLFDKPVDRDDARAHLEAFSGATMLLYSAAVIAENGAPVWRHVDKAELVVRPLSAAWIEAYLASEWPDIAGSVGCARLESRGAQMFTAIRGDHFTIYGMPLLPILGFLRERGVMTS